ncbi:MAG: tRNA adenosine(34) deaminase TadA [Pseudomonadales bacterium]|jgi:tRNA(adenine34) deaminase|nr:tRNA adenosine(34) deaminase TadA [Pseudomonadales bacterium]
MNDDSLYADRADVYWMRQALELAREAEEAGEVPVGAVLVREGQLLGQGYNRPITSCDPSAHAEIVTLRAAAAAAANYRLPGSTLYVTLEPCTMCVGAMIHARVERLVFGALEPRAGAVVSQHQLAAHPAYNHQMQVQGGVLQDECAALLRDFFRRKR